MDGFSLPTDDGSIQRAMAELEAKLTDWTTRVHHAHEKLLGLARSSSAATATPAPSSRSSKPAEPKSAEPKSEEKRAKERLGAGLDAPAHRFSPPAGEAATTPAPSPAVTEKPPEPAPPAQNAEDEALLAALDDHTAQAIRIIRRLNPSRKTVRELIEEYRQVPENEAAATQTRGRLWKRMRP